MAIVPEWTAPSSQIYRPVGKYAPVGVARSSLRFAGMSDVIRETGRRYRNWGKWGADDERGTLN